MPTIRLDQDVYEGLKKLAEPFVDTPNAVIRKLLAEKGVLQPAAVRSLPPARLIADRGALTPDLTPQAMYEQFLLVTLAQNFGGQGDKRRVTQAVIEKMVKHGFIHTADLDLVATGETRAENTISWSRNALKNRGLVARGSKRGLWELTEEGLQAANAVLLPKR